MNKSTAEIRQAFLDFFYTKGHKVIESNSLVSKNDPTLLFTNAGMNQFKDIFLGLDTRYYSRATTSQRCMRAGGKHNDLENVGYTARHHTFFEMLGNFSFGDYFKHEAIIYAWELLTDKKWFNLPKEKLWITVYATDHEAFEIWQKYIGVATERIIRIGDNKGTAFVSDNFWQMGDTGPCGPCTEIFYDHGDNIRGGPPGSSKEHGDRYIEIWNIVFIQFNRQSDGTMVPLRKPSVDTGMGLERIAAVLQNVHSNYEIDIFRVLIANIAKITNTTDLSNKSLRVIADHIRACAFLISDGIMPSRENRGYVLRRIIRRAIRHGNMLGVKETFLYKLVAPLIEVMGFASHELKRQQSLIEQVLKTEEEQFSITLENALVILNNELNKLSGKILDGSIAFRLYDTFGFPFDLTADICRERGIKVDKSSFNKAMELQQSRARSTSNFNSNYNSLICIDGSSQFCGYVDETQQAIVIALFRDGQVVEKIHAGEEAIVVLNITPFYGESGGQVGDTGILKGTEMDFIVSDTKKYGPVIGHVGKLSHGFLKVNDRVNAQIDIVRRNRICLNHSATHLLHAALRQTLGNAVTQKGSLVNDQYLRFDFSYNAAMQSEQIRIVEYLVNQKVRCNIPIQIEIMPIEDAKAKGAIALFGEKYADNVRVLTIGGFSTELCAGTHTNRTGDIGLFHILTESSTAAGTRRIEAVTGENAIAKLHQKSDLLQIIANLLKSDNSNIENKLRTIIDHSYILEKDLQKLKNKQISEICTALSSQVKEAHGVQILVSQVDQVESKMLRMMVNRLKNTFGSAIIVLATTFDNKINLIAGVTKDLTDRINAAELVCYVARQIGGNGGGKPDIAQAGGTDINALPSALNSVVGWVTCNL